MPDDIVIVRAQIGLAYERIHVEDGKWHQEYAHWCDVPLTDINRNNLANHRAKYDRREDYRNLRWAWRGVMTNTIHGDDLASLETLGYQMTRPHEENWVVALGTAFDGLTLHGPFPDVPAAALWAERESMENWEVTGITKP